MSKVWYNLPRRDIMKFGVRKPNLKKSLRARTTGKVKRKVKRSINPFYGKKGMGWLRNPNKALYNKVYNKTTISAKDLLKGAGKVIGMSKKNI